LNSSNPVKHRRNPILELLYELVILQVGNIKLEPILLGDKGMTAGIESTYLRIVIPCIKGYVEISEVWCNGCLATAPANMPVRCNGLYSLLFNH
jgi:hypothetical protein